MTEKTDRAALPLEVKHYFEANEYLGFNPAWGVDLVGRLAAVLADAERDIADQVATIEAIREWWSTTLWTQPDWPSLMAILYPEQGTK